MSNDMVFKIKLEKGEKEFDLSKELKINENKLDVHLMRQPSKFARYATLTALAWARAKRAKYALEEYENKLDLDIRKKADEKEGKLTENQIKALVKTDSERMSLVNALIEAEEQAEIVQAAKQAFEERKDCLLSLAYSRRSKYEDELSVKERKKD